MQILCITKIHICILIVVGKWHLKFLLPIISKNGLLDIHGSPYEYFNRLQMMCNNVQRETTEPHSGLRWAINMSLKCRLRVYNKI